MDWYPWLGWVLGFLVLWRVPLVRRDSPAASPRSVTVIVPARDEAANLEPLLASLAAPPSGGAIRSLEIIVVDDGSSDDTAAVARRRGAAVVSSAPLPDGWVGKPWACWQGAQAAAGEVLVFLDADTRVESGGLAAIVAEQQRAGGLLSVQPYHRMERPYERLAAFFNLVTLAGLGSFTVLGERLSPMGAFGPCVACVRNDYLAVGGHRSARDAVIEGVPLGRAFLAAGFPVRNAGGRGALSFCMYPRGFAEMARGFARSFATGSRAVAPWLLIAIVVWMAGGIAATRHLIGAAAGSGEPFLRWLALDILYVLQLRWLLGRVGNFGWWPALFFQIPLAFFMGVFSVSLLQTFGRRRVHWKGREVRVAPR